MNHIERVRTLVTAMKNSDNFIATSYEGIIDACEMASERLGRMAKAIKAGGTPGKNQLGHELAKLINALIGAGIMAGADMEKWLTEDLEHAETDCAREIGAQ